MSINEYLELLLCFAIYAISYQKKKLDVQIDRRRIIITVNSMIFQREHGKKYLQFVLKVHDVIERFLVIIDEREDIAHKKFVKLMHFFCMFAMSHFSLSILQK